MELGYHCKRAFLKVPLINSLLFFSGRTHKAALAKFFVLWLGSTAPIIFSVLLSDLPNVSAEWEEQFLVLVEQNISAPELFVYCASFLTPLLYIVFDRYFDEGGEGFRDRLAEASKVFAGYRVHFLLAFILLIVTAVGYSAAKTSMSGYSDTLLSFLLTKGAIYIYLYSLLCMYLVVLDENGKNSGDFVEANRKQEDDLASDFSARLGHRTGGGK